MRKESLRLLTAVSLLQILPNTAVCHTRNGGSNRTHLLSWEVTHMSTLIEQPRYSCALGAQQTVVAIPRAVPILHSGPGCSIKISDLIGQGEAYAGGSTIPCTNSGEAEIVYGGEKRLREVIDGALQVIDADLYVVLTGCTSDIVGDDVERITADYQELGHPIV